MEISIRAFSDALAFLGGVNTSAAFSRDPNGVTWIGAIAPTYGVVRYRLEGFPLPLANVEIDVRAMGEYARALAGIAPHGENANIALSWGEGGPELRTAFSCARIAHSLGNPLPEVSTGDAPPIAIEAHALRVALEGVIGATERIGARPALECVLLDVGEGAPQLVATDGYRLAVAPLALADEGVAPMLIHWRDAQLWSRWLKKRPGGDVVLRIGSGYALLGDEAWQLIAPNRINFHYPDYRAIIPPNMPTSARLELHVAGQLVRAATALVDKNKPGATLTISDSELTLKTPNTERGQAQLRAPAQTVGEDEAMINAQYLRDALGALDDVDVEVAFGAAHQPVRVRGVNSGITHYIMPLRKG